MAKTLNKKLGKQFDIDVQFTTLMNSKEQYSAVMDIILRKEVKDKFKYGGAFMFGYKDTDLSDLVDSGGPSHDLVSENFKKNVKGSKLKQSVYKDLKSFFNANKPDEKKETIYFVGDANGKGQYLDVHWNCFIVTKNNVLWYDPSHKKGDVKQEETQLRNILDDLTDYNSDEDEDYEFSGGDDDYTTDEEFMSDSEEESEPEQYNFDSNKQNDIIDTINSIIKGKDKSLILIEPTEPAQQICITERDGEEVFSTDVFCQSWVLMFAAAHVEGVRNEFLTKLDFVKLQNIPLKQWLMCLFSQMGYGKADYKEALSKARIECIETEKCTLQTIKCMERDLKVPCILQILEYYGKK